MHGKSLRCLGRKRDKKTPRNKKKTDTGQNKQPVVGIELGTKKTETGQKTILGKQTNVKRDLKNMGKKTKKSKTWEKKEEKK